MNFISVNKNNTFVPNKIRSKKRVVKHSKQHKSPLLIEDEELPLRTNALAKWIDPKFFQYYQSLKGQITSFTPNSIHINCRNKHKN